MTNDEKFEEHHKTIEECKKMGLQHMKPSVYQMEKLKYSDDPLVRKAGAIIEYADEVLLDMLIKGAI